MTTIQEFDFNVDLLKVILWEYNDAEKIRKILNQKQDWYNKNQTKFWQDWYRNVFNLDTANDFGCAVWSIILDIPLVFEMGTNEENESPFGFGENNQNFFRSNFYSLRKTESSLTTVQKRLVLKLRYFSLTTDCSTPSINEFLKNVFGDAYILDSRNMEYVIYVFNDTLTAEYKAVLDMYDLLPRPAGVGRKIIYGDQPIFGFGKFNQNFNNGNFANFK